MRVEFHWCKDKFKNMALPYSGRARHHRLVENAVFMGAYRCMFHFLCYRQVGPMGHQKQDKKETGGNQLLGPEYERTPTPQF
jgi:hypothetical protein